MTTCIAAESAATRLNGVDCLGIAVDRFGVEQIKRIEDIIVEPWFSDIKSEQNRDTQSTDSYRRLLKCPGVCDSSECVDLA